MSRNEFPDSFRSKEDLLNIGIILFFVYVMSAAIGLFANRIVLLFSLDTRWSILKFSNVWQYIIKPTSIHGMKKKLGEKYITYIDILVTHKDKDELYKGIVNDFILDKENKLENIIISDSKRFIDLYTGLDDSKIESLRSLSNDDDTGIKLHKEYGDKVTFTKKVEGDLLVIPNENILNINFSYFRIFKRTINIKRLLIRIIFLILYLAFFLLLLFPFLNIEAEYFSTIYKKIIFSITTTFLVTFLISFIQNLILKENRKTILNDFILLVFGIPYLWIFDVTSIVLTVILFIIIVLLLALILEKYNK